MPSLNESFSASEEIKKVSILKVIEVVQAGDLFLLRFECWKCREELLIARNHLVCECGMDYRPFPMEVPTRSQHRCLSGTTRKKYISKSIVRRLIEIQGNDCAYCMLPMTDIHIEHIIPISIGGTNNISNLVLSCPRCNQLAANLVFQTLERKREWIMARRDRLQQWASLPTSGAIQGKRT